MKTLYKKSLKARDLPPEWQQEGSFAPDEQVTVTIEPADLERARAASLEALMDMIGYRAQARGLNEDKLQEILHEP